MVKVAPSILSANFANLGADVSALCQAGADFIHVDVMDGHFVPNLTMGPMIVAAIKPFSTVPLDVHLMMSKPEVLLEAFIHAGADRLTLHAELQGDLQKWLEDIKKQDVKAGLCLKPSTPAEVLEPYLDILDLVLVMTVEPGFGGQPFQAAQVSKIRRVKELVGDRPIDIQVDGGINAQTAPKCVQAGADVLIAGNYILKSTDWRAAIQGLKDLS